MRDVSNGWLIRYLHSNTASAFFFLVYLHIGRGFYYASYRAPRTLAWIIGVVILILMMGIGFLGYVHIAPNGYKNNKITIVLRKLGLHPSPSYTSKNKIHFSRSTVFSTCSISFN